MGQVGKPGLGEGAQGTPPVGLDSLHKGVDEACGERLSLQFFQRGLLCRLFFQRLGLWVSQTS